MNNKGQGQVGMFIMVAIAVIVGTILLVASAQEVGKSTDTIAVVNYSLDGVTNGTQINITEYKFISGVTVINETHGNAIGAGNYTITNNVIDPVSGDLKVTIDPTVSDPEDGWNWKASFTAQPLGYITDSGGRSIAGLIIIFFALLVAIIALIPVLKEKFF